MHRKVFTNAKATSHAASPPVVRAQNHLTHSIKPTALDSMHVYEVCPRKDKLGVDLISDQLLFGRSRTQDRATFLIDRLVTERSPTLLPGLDFFTSRRFPVRETRSIFSSARTTNRFPSLRVLF